MKFAFHGPSWATGVLTALVFVGVWSPWMLLIVPVALLDGGPSWKLEWPPRDFEAAELAAQRRAPSPSMVPVSAGIVGALVFSLAILVFQVVAGIPGGAYFWAEVVAAVIGFGGGYLLNLERWNRHSRAHQEELQKRREQINA